MPSARAQDRLRTLALVLGPLLGVFTYVMLPAQATLADGTTTGVSHSARACAGCAVLMAVWWISEALPLGATALVPLALFPLTGVQPMARVAPAYAADVIALFFGGFVLGLAVERCGLHRRLALAVLRVSGTSARRVLLGLMLATAGLSMFVSNTATCATMLPIASSVAAFAGEGEPARRLRMTLLLGIAYASSIGGVGTLIGTPPTALLAGVAEKSLGASISFASWMLVGVPVAFALLVITWLLLVRLTGPARLAPPELLREPWTPAQRRVAFILALTAALWVARPWLTALGADRGITALAGLTDAGIAVLAALSLFIVRGERGRQLMDWEGLSALPWGVLVLFGGGLALAGAMTETGLDTHLAGALGGLRGVPLWVACLCVAAIATFASELASNTAIASALLPVLAAAGATLSLDPMPLMVAGTLGASLAFMLPVGTPPNAMVYATGHIKGGEMARIGLLLNFAAVIVITLASSVLVPAVLRAPTP